jgi:hypothetical protein
VKNFEIFFRPFLNFQPANSLKNPKSLRIYRLGIWTKTTP